MTKNTTTTFKQIDCHKGNSLIYKEPNGGSLFIGGWTHDASFDWNTHVIDLTGSEHKLGNVAVPFDDTSKAFMPFIGQSFAGWLSLPFPDFGVPSNIQTLPQWQGITNTIREILRKETNVLVACHGGHGRSGLFCAIVGYLLNIQHDRTWASPVEKIRDLHCSLAVETYGQEQFVYDVLGLDIKVTRTYAESFPTTYTYKECPLCGTQSMFVSDFGMCMGCQEKMKKGDFGAIPVRLDLTLEDIKNHGLVTHSCTIEKCMGIWKAEKCGHTVHDMVIYEGWCTTCWDKHQEEIEFAEKQLDNEREDGYREDDKCCMCDKPTIYAKKYGICYECQDDVAMSGQAEEVHNSITDPYRAVKHHCSEYNCIGVMIADKCKHVVHNREIEDGLCPSCLVLKKRGVQ